MAKEQKEQSDTLQEAYFDRNQLVLAFAKLAAKQGYVVGKDASGPDWPIIRIKLPQGQVSWHLSKSDMVMSLPDFPEEWDGHHLEEKRARMKQFILA